MKILFFVLAGVSFLLALFGAEVFFYLGIILLVLGIVFLTMKNPSLRPPSGTPRATRDSDEPFDVQHDRFMRYYEDQEKQRESIFDSMSQDEKYQYWDDDRDERDDRDDDRDDFGGAGGGWGSDDDNGWGDSDDNDWDDDSGDDSGSDDSGGDD